MDLLIEEGDSFAQIILTTHTHLWFERFKNHTVGAKRCEPVELVPWAFERGIRTTKALLDGEELRAELEKATIDRH